MLKGYYRRQESILPRIPLASFLLSLIIHPLVSQLFMRTSHSFLSSKLKDYDDTLRSIVSTVTNTNLDDNAWIQATLPVKSGGLSIRSAIHLAPSAFLSSASASNDLVHHILPPRFVCKEILHVDAALTSWLHGHDHPPPLGCLQSVSHGRYST